MKNTISIDFGTSNSTVCWINPRTGMPEVIKDRNGSEKIPSVVYWGAGNEVLVGEAALARLGDAQHDEADSLDAMQRIVKSVKRDLRHNRPRVLPDGRLLKPVDTVAMILGHLKHLAENAAFHEAVDTVVLTHPVKMTQREKELLDEAARKAGFQTILFKEEPVAAAHGYLAHGAKVGAGILVFDLGGGTLDLAFLQRDADGSYRMPVECMGDADCGGDDYDQIVYDHWEGQFQAQHGRGFAARSGEINPYVLLECRKAKEKLTDMQTARLSFLFRKDGHHEQALFALTRKEFEVLSGAYVQKAVEHTRKMLKRIDESGHRVDTVLLIGGATRMPLLREELKAVLPVALTETMYADVAVALGGMPKAAEPTREPTPARILEPEQLIRAASAATPTERCEDDAVMVSVQTQAIEKSSASPIENNSGIELTKKAAAGGPKRETLPDWQKVIYTLGLVSICLILGVFLPFSIPVLIMGGSKGIGQIWKD